MRRRWMSVFVMVALLGVGARTQAAVRRTEVVITGPDDELVIRLAGPDSPDRRYVSNRVSLRVTSADKVNLKVEGFLAKCFEGTLPPEEVAELLEPELIMTGQLPELLGEPMIKGSKPGHGVGPQTILIQHLPAGGAYTFDLHIESGWNRELSWWQLPSGTYTGEVVLTVSGSPK